MSNPVNEAIAARDREVAALSRMVKLEEAKRRPNLLAGASAVFLLAAIVNGSGAWIGLGGLLAAAIWRFSITEQQRVMFEAAKEHSEEVTRTKNEAAARDFLERLP